MSAGCGEGGGVADEKGMPLCAKCNVDMTPQKTFFQYLGHSFSADLPTCPRCGQVYVPEEIVVGRMAQVEQMLEDK